VQKVITSRFPTLFALIPLVLVTLAIFFPRFYAVQPGDFASHYILAQIVENGKSQILHILYHILVIILGNALGINESYQPISLVLALLLRSILAVELFLITRLKLGNHISKLWAGIIVVAFLLSSPIYTQITTAFIGYINYLVYHNPTQQLLSVFVVPVSLFAVRAAFYKPYKSLNQRIFFTLLCMLLVLLMSLSKPSYSIALLPALALIVLCRLLYRLPVDWLLLSLGIALPTILMLALQYLVTYSDPEKASVQLGWFVFFQAYGLNAWDILTGLLLSILFPLATYLLYFKDAVRDRYLNFSWLVFAVSLIWSYFFHEGGSRLMHGNFLWSSYVSLLVLMFSTLLFLLRAFASQKGKIGSRGLLAAIAFAAHFAFGIYSYFHLLLSVLRR
jgi:hypothetical protein